MSLLHATSKQKRGIVEESYQFMALGLVHKLTPCHSAGALRMATVEELTGGAEITGHAICDAISLG